MFQSDVGDPALSKSLLSRPSLVRRDLKKKERKKSIFSLNKSSNFGSPKIDFFNFSHGACIVFYLHLIIIHINNTVPK